MLYSPLFFSVEGQMKRLLFTAAGVAVLVFTYGTVASARSGATIDTFPVSFVLSSTCSNLPSGTVLAGSGIQKSITTTRIDRNGVVTIENSSHASGTAIDQAGNVYVFNYSNEFRATVDGGGVFSGSMTDAFALAGRGPARLNNGFSGHFVSDFATFFTVPDVTNSHGDPLDFATGDVHCDPL
jgi:hypothetical protein